MTHEELVEKVAMEIRARRDGAGCTPWQRITAAHKEPYRCDARAALSVVAEALRGPTPEMVRAALASRAVSDEGQSLPLFALLDFSGENSARSVVAFALSDALAASPLYPDVRADSQPKSSGSTAPPSQGRSRADDHRQASRGRAL